MAEAQKPEHFSIANLDSTPSESPPTWSTRPASFLESVGVRMMGGMLTSIVVVTAGVLALWWLTLPTADHLASDLRSFATTQPSMLKPEDVVQLLATRNASHHEAFRGMFQLLVLSGLVPLFTLMAGYVFGKTKS